MIIWIIESDIKPGAPFIRGYRTAKIALDKRGAKIARRYELTRTDFVAVNARGTNNDKSPKHKSIS